MEAENPFFFEKVGRGDPTYIYIYFFFAFLLNERMRTVQFTGPPGPKEK